MSDRNYVLYVGRIDRFKGIDTLARAINELKLAKINVKCIIIGPDVRYRPKLELLIDYLRIADRVEIKSPVSQENLVKLYSSALVTVLAWSSEGFGLSVFESLASGTPFIATPVGVIPELVSQTKAGIIVPIGDSKALARAIINLSGDKVLWSEMSTSGKRLIVRPFF